MGLAGLAFSGGGIRSASFCLGVLQALADAKLLAKFDYLSTVSGGGYIGSWLTAWIRRTRSAKAVIAQLQSTRASQSADGAPSEAEPEPIVHLRAYSNYMTPRLGVNSGDSWVLAATYLRNFVLNHLVLLPFIVAVMLLPRAAQWLCAWDAPPTGEGGPLLMTVSMALALTAIFHAFFRLYRRGANRMPPGPARRWTRAAAPWALLAVGCVAIVPAAALHAFRANDVWATLAGVIAVSCVTVGFDFFAQNALARTRWRALWWRISARGDRGETAKRVLWTRVLAPLFVWSIATTWFVCAVTDYLTTHPGFWPMSWLLGGGLALAGGLLSAAFLLRQGPTWVVDQRMKARPWVVAWWIVFNIASGFVVGFASGFLLQNGCQWLRAWAGDDPAGDAFRSAVMATVGPPLCLTIFALGSVLQSGLAGSWRNEAQREWWASLCGWILMSAGVWLAVSGVTLFALPLLMWINSLGKTVIGGGWLATAVGGLWAGRSPRTGSPSGGRGWELLARIGPYVLLMGMMVFLAGGISWVIDDRPPLAAPAEVPVAAPANDQGPSAFQRGRAQNAAPRGLLLAYDKQPQRQAYWQGMLPEQPRGPRAIKRQTQQQAHQAAETQRAYGSVAWKLLGWTVVCALVSGIFSWRVGVNAFSLQGAYANRLVRCYLGASRRKYDKSLDRRAGTPADGHGARRRPNPLTGFSPSDDLPLHQAYEPDEGGPYPLVNAALNLTQGEELAWQERKAEAFLFSPLYCGSVGTGYRRTGRYGGPVSLGTAMAVSGSAVSPNMGYHTSAAVTALLTMFNVRLGVWLGNPAGTSWRRREPGFALGLLLNELFGRTNRHSRYVYLSDGGHFENLGVYELIRRRCRLIVVCDAGADPNYDCADLGGLVRKSPVDLGVPIEIHPAPLAPGEEGAFGAVHCVPATIHYECVDPQAEPGTLLYIKASLTGDEPADVLAYRAGCKRFPHESTADQFFGESQFESYRALGQHVGEEALGDVVEEVDSLHDHAGQIKVFADAITRRAAAKLKEAMKVRSSPQPFNWPNRPA